MQVQDAQDTKERVPMHKKIFVAGSIVSLIIGGGFTATQLLTPSNPDRAASVALMDSPEAFYLNEDTGRITRMVSRDGIEVFNEGFAPTDVKVTPVEASSSQGNPQINQTIEVAGKQYPVSASLVGQLPSQEGGALIAFYNEHIATPGPSPYKFVASSKGVPVATSLSLSGAVYDYVHDEVEKALTNGTLPAAEFAANGETLTHTDARIAQNWAAGAPASDVFPVVYSTVSTTSDTQYGYVFSCSTVGVSANFDAMIGAAQALFPTIDIQFSGRLNSTEILVDTAEPCDLFVDAPKSPGNPPMNSGDKAPLCDLDDCTSPNSKDPYEMVPPPVGVNSENPGGF